MSLHLLFKDSFRANKAMKFSKDLQNIEQNLICQIQIQIIVDRQRKAEINHLKSL